MNVVITGTSSGLGQELAATYRQQGHNVIGSCVSKDDEKHDQWQMDLGDSADVMAFAQAVRRSMSDRIDVLINNAGINAICRFEMLEEQFIQRIMNVNFIGPVMLTEYLLPALRGGSVVNIVSDAAWRPMRHSLAYNCSKAALDMATKQMARELTKPYEISFVGIRPGKMHGTGMSQYIDEQVCAVRKWTPEEAKQYFVANSVTGFEMLTDDVADLIYHITSTGLIRYMSGACIDLVG